MSTLTVQSEIASQAAYEDFRYQPLKCASCDRSIQRIDFYGNPHVFFCHDPIPVWPCKCDAGPCPLDKGAHLGSHFYCRART